ncbi:MAG: GtrA family protein [Oscillospiraceae bacterium]|nr:GtrA family protein [Oscillospiraceae bacterium]
MKDKIKSLFDEKLWKFLLVGVLNTIVGEGLKALLLAFTSLAPLPASAISTAIASVMSYFLNRYFTFKYKGDNAKAILRFTLNIAVCYILSHAIALLVIYPLLTGAENGWLSGLSLIAAEKKTAADYIATYSGSVLFVGFNYLGQRFFAFREEKETPEEE